MDQPNFSNHDGNEFHSPTLRDLFAIIFRHRRLMALSFCGILLGAIVAAVRQPNRYDAGMKILVKRERVDPVVTSEASAQSQFAVAVTEEDLNSEVELLKSRDMLEKVVAVTCYVFLRILRTAMHENARAVQSGRHVPDSIHRVRVIDVI